MIFMYSMALERIQSLTQRRLSIALLGFKDPWIDRIRPALHSTSSRQDHSFRAVGILCPSYLANRQVSIVRSATRSVGQIATARRQSAFQPERFLDHRYSLL